MRFAYPCHQAVYICMDPLKVFCTSFGVSHIRSCWVTGNNFSHSMRYCTIYSSRMSNHILISTSLHEGKKHTNRETLYKILEPLHCPTKNPGITSKPKPLPMPESKYVQICWNGRLWPFKSDAPCIKVQWNEMDHRLAEPIGVHLLNIRYKHRSECIYCTYKSICKYLSLYIYKY